MLRPLTELGPSMRETNTLGGRRPVSGPIQTAIVLGGFGFGVWIALSIIGGLASDEGGFKLREAWDTAAYFYLGLPLMALAVAIAGFIKPNRVWRWPLALVAGHMAGVLVLGLGMQSGLSLILLTLILAVLLCVFFAVPAALGAMASRKLTAPLS
jgi:hypothetical protein